MIERGILSDVLSAVESQERRLDALGRYIALCAEQDGRLWDDLAALRDDLHAVVNRVESVSRAVFADAAGKGDIP